MISTPVFFSIIIAIFVALIIITILECKNIPRPQLYSRAYVHNKIKKPWGFYHDFHRTKECVVKTIVVHPGQKLSLQAHNHRGEYWAVIQGSPTLEIDGEELYARVGSVVHVLPEVKHRIMNNTKQIVEIFEVQVGHCSESDIIRYEDDYGRN